MLAQESHWGGGEVSENSQAWVFTFWALPPSTNRRTSAAHLKGVRSAPIGREANRGRREQMSWERRANSQTKSSKREVKTFKPATGHGADSVLSQLRLHTHMHAVHLCKHVPGITFCGQQKWTRTYKSGSEGKEVEKMLMTTWAHFSREYQILHYWCGFCRHSHLPFYNNTSIINAFSALHRERWHAPSF